MTVEVTLEELKDRLIVCMDPDTLIYLLDISIEEMVEAFSDKIEDNYEQLIEELPDDELGTD